MAVPPPSDAPDPDLLQRADQGESACLAELFTCYRPRLAGRVRPLFPFPAATAVAAL